MKFTTLLPPAAAHQSGARRSALITDHDDPGSARFRVSAASHVARQDDEEPVLEIAVRSNYRWVILGLNRRLTLCAIVHDLAEGEAAYRWRQLMARNGLDVTGAGRPLLPPKQTHGGPRRSSLLIDADDPDYATHQLSGKRIGTPEGDLLQLRVYASGFWTQIVLDEHLGLVAFAAADTEKASWKAAQAGLYARGWTI